MPKPNYREPGELSFAREIALDLFSHFSKHIDPTASKLRSSKACRVCQKDVEKQRGSVKSAKFLY